MKPEMMIKRLRHLLAGNTYPRLMVGRKLLEGALDVVLEQRAEAARLKEALDTANRECAAVKAERDAAVAEIPHECNTCKHRPPDSFGICGMGCEIEWTGIYHCERCNWEWSGPGKEA